MCISFLSLEERNALGAQKNGETPERLSVFWYVFQQKVRPPSGDMAFTRASDSTRTPLSRTRAPPGW